MCGDLKSLKQKPIPKLKQKLKRFEKISNNFKNPKSQVKDHEMHDKEGESIIPNEEHGS